MNHCVNIISCVHCTLQITPSPTLDRMSRSKVTAMSVTTTGSSTTPTTKITEELLSCQLCSLKYRVDGRRPMALRCVHTFCEVCLEQLLCEPADNDETTKNQKQRKNKRQQLVCPTCETVTPLGRGSTPSSLPVNPSVMHLLEIFDRSSNGGRHDPALRPNEVASGFSQVTVVASTSSLSQGTTANGLINPDPTKSSMSAFVKRVKDTKRCSLNSDNHLIHGNVHKTGGDDDDKVSNMNWVSTVNVGQPSQKQQHQQPQQHSTSSLAEANRSSATVTSVSTMKMQPNQPTSGVVSAADRPTDDLPTSSAGVRHKCGRCGEQPATVSVASSSQNMAPQKLCSNCWNQPEKRGPGAESGVEKNSTRTVSTKQPSASVEGISTARVETARANYSATVANPTPKNNAAAKNCDDSPSLDSVRRDPVANGKSTIEVRRRSTYVDNRSLAAPTSTQDSDRGAGRDSRSVVLDPRDQSGAVQNSKGPASLASAANNTQQPPAVETTAFVAQSSAVLETAPEATSANSVSSADNSGTEFVEQDVGHYVTHCRCSAPAIADIYPLPCSNPPYNPEFDEHADATTPGGLNPNPSETQSRNEHQQRQKQRDITATAGRGMALSFVLSNSSRHHRHPVEQPPKYEDIIYEKPDIATAPDAPSHTPLSQAPIDLVTTNVTTAAMKLVHSFGKYGEISTQPGAFRAPGRISVSRSASAKSSSTRIVIADSANGTVQVFGADGDCMSMIRADHVRGCCLINDCQRLIVATDRGIDVGYAFPSQIKSKTNLCSVIISKVNQKSKPLLRTIIK